MTDGSDHSLKAGEPRRPSTTGTGSRDSPYTVLGDFELHREIGRGGMGMVYEARQRSLNRIVAVKVLSRNVSSARNAVKRFQREAQAAAKLHHAHIVPIFALGEEGGVYYYAMELIDGPGLNTLIAQMREHRDTSSPAPDQAETVPLGRTAPAEGNGAATAPDPDSKPARSAVTFGLVPERCTREAYFTEVAAHVATIADALDYAHQQGVIHRDVKPHNLILGSDGQMRISDFGLARLSQQPGVTITGELLGSPLYMSPEQISGGRTPVDHRTDVYSLGATMYEWLTLHPPYPGETREQVISKILTSEAPGLSVHNPAVPVDLETICLKAIERDPGRRYPSAGALRDDLQRFLRKQPIKARRANLPTRLWKLVTRHQIASLTSATALLALLLSWALISEKHEVRTQMAVAEQAREDTEKLLENLRQLFPPETLVQLGIPIGASVVDLRSLLPGEMDGALRVAEAAMPVLKEMVGQEGASSGPPGRRFGPDAAAVAEPAGIARRAAHDFYSAVVSEPAATPAPPAPGAVPARAASASTAEAADECARLPGRASDLWNQSSNEALPAVEACLELRPNDFALWQLHVALLGWFGLFEQMLDSTQALVRRYPSEANAYTWRGLAHMLAGSAEATLRDLDSATNLGGASGWLLTLRGLALAGAARAPDAIATFDQALARTPDAVVALLGRAGARAQQKDLKGAISDLTRVLDLEPGNANVLALRGDHYASLGRYAAAATDYDQAMSIAGRTPSMVLRYLFARAQRPRRADESSDRTAAPDFPRTDSSDSPQDSDRPSLWQRAKARLAPGSQKKRAPGT